MPKIRLTFGRWRKAGERPIYTVLLLPHSSRRFRKLQLSRGFVVVTGALLGGALLAGLLSPHLLFKLQTQSAALDQLQRENETLRLRSERFEEELGAIADQLAGYEDRSGRLASALGIEGGFPPPAAGGGEMALPRSGGQHSLFDQEIEALQSRTDSLESSFEELDDRFRERMRRLSSTPSIMPVPGWFSHGFGWRKDPWSGKRQFHRGIDIVADAGTPIRATADGLVSRATRVADYGKMVDLSHGFGYVTRYGHMSEILVKPGQQVRRGDVIGRVGSTGRSTGPHVHYEVFRDGRRVNPWKYLGNKGS
jgi:murein DD-endopeptidase MepM/ murein hydrolase activator NlpD